MTYDARRLRALAPVPPCFRLHHLVALVTGLVVLAGTFGLGVMVGFDWCAKGDARMMAEEARGERCAP